MSPSLLKKPPQKSGPHANKPGVQSPYARLAICVFLLLAVFLVFGRTLNFDFVNYDDNEYVYDNPQITHGLTLQGIGWAFSHRHSCNWHPVTWLSHMLDCQLYGLAPWGHHLTNVLLHAATVISLFLVLQRMTGDLWPSAFVAAVFAIHPLRVESVAWVAERKDVLSGLFFMLTLWAYVVYVSQRFSLYKYFAVLILFALGLMAKPMLVTLPFVLLLLDYWPLERMISLASENQPLSGIWRIGRFSVLLRLVAEKVPLFILAAASCAVTIWAQHDAIRANEQIPLSLRINNAVVSYVAYLGQMFYPAGLAVLYPHWEIDLTMWNVLAALVVLVMISGGVVLLRRQYPSLLVGWLWYLGMLAPVIGLIQVGSHAMADRYTYLPQIGLYIALAWGVAQFTRSWSYRGLAFIVTSTLVLIILMGSAWRQTAYWQNSETLWTHTLDCTSLNYVAHNNLGLTLSETGRMPEAADHYQQALRIKSDYPSAHYNFGLLLAHAGRFTEAIEHYNQVLRMEPHNVEVLNNLGVALVDIGQAPEGIKHYEEALRLKPDFPQARHNLGLALAKQGRMLEAIEQYQQFLYFKPDDADEHNNLGLALVNIGRAEEAITHYQLALRLKSDSAETHYNLAIALDKIAQPQKAIEHYREALKLKPSYAEAYNNIGKILVEAGRPSEGIEYFQQALHLKPDYPEAHNNLGCALVETDRLTEATEHFILALQLRPDYINACNNLALVYAKLHQDSEAIAAAQKALEFARSQGQTAQVKKIEDWLKTYRAGLSEIQMEAPAGKSTAPRP